MASSSRGKTVGQYTDAVTTVDSTKSFYSIDVECFATGKRHDSRAVGQVSLVDDAENVLLDVYVKPEVPVLSYLTPVSGLTKELLDTKGFPLGEAIRRLKQLLPRDAVLVGQNIKQDIEWLGLQRGKDYADEVNLGELYRVYVKKRDRFVYFPLTHLVKVLIGSRQAARMHNAAQDAKMSVRLYNYYKRIKGTSALRRVRKEILYTKADPSFNVANPIFEGACMGNKSVCNCGAPFRW